MPWTPDDDELAKVWLATQDLVRRGQLVFNVSRQHGSGVPATARDLLVEVNEHGLDIMRGGSCIYPPTKVLDLLAKERGVEPEALFSNAEVQGELAEIARVDALIAEAAANDRPLTESVAQSMGAVRSSWRSVLESLTAFALVLPLTVLGLVFLRRYSSHANIFLGVFLLGFVFTALELFRGVFNPARLFREAEALRGAVGLSSKAKRSVVHYVARDVAFFFALFVMTAAAFHAVDPAAFITPSESPGVAQWLVYGLDNLVRTVGLDVAEVFGLHVSAITHSDALLPQLLVFSFRTLFSVVGIALIAGATRRYGER